MNTRKHPDCTDFEEMAVLYAVRELSADEQAVLQEHVKECAGCAAAFDAELRLHAELAEMSQPADVLDASGFLLAQCRSELFEAIDDGAQNAKAVTPEIAADLSSSKPGWGVYLAPAYWAGALRRMMQFHPGWSTAALLVAGALGSAVGSTWYRQAANPAPGEPVMTVSAAPRLSDQELETMGVQGISLQPQNGADSPRVQLQLRAKRPLVVEGTSDDGELRRVLTYVIQHEQQFDPGVRLDSLDALRTRTADPQVRTALCAAALRDRNPAVRLAAIDALRQSIREPEVRQAMLQALSEDENSGVRIEALNALLAPLNRRPGRNNEDRNGDDRKDAAERSGTDRQRIERPRTGPGPADEFDSRALAILRERMHNDPNNYVRSRSASAVGLLTSAGDGRVRETQPESGMDWRR